MATLHTSRQRALRSGALCVTQNGGNVDVEVSLPSGATALKLWLRAEPEWIDLGVFEYVAQKDDGTSRFRAHVSFASALDEHRREILTEYYAKDRDSSGSAEELDEESDGTGVPMPSTRVTLNLFVEVSASPRQFTGRRQSIDIRPALAGLDPATGFIALGRFAQTHLTRFSPITLGDDSIYLYVTRRGNVVVGYNRIPKRRLRSKVTGARIRGRELVISGHITTNHAPLSAYEVVLSGRVTGEQLPLYTEVTPDDQFAESHWGRRRYSFTAVLDLRGASRFAAESDIDDIFDVWSFGQSPHYPITFRHRLGSVPFIQRQLLNEGWAAHGETGVYVSPYCTFKAKRLSVRIEVFQTAALTEMISATHRTVPTGRNSAALRSRNPVWIVGEMPFKAQDSGLEFFAYLRKNHPEIDAYYVIQPDSPDYPNLAGLDHVVQFRSVEHIRLVLAADRIIGTHHPDYLYPSRSRRFAKAVHGTKVFLQHGMIGLRRIANLYGVRNKDFTTDAFLVSSEREKSIIVNHFGYEKDRVHITGLARHDRLFRGSTTQPSSPDIAIIPTWREWLGNETTFAGSEYLSQWLELCSDPALHSAAAKRGGRLRFYIHPNLRQYRHYFESTGVEVVDPSDVKMQDLLIEDCLLITDYSSAALDFSVLHKPVVYFQFDRTRFFAEPPYLSLERDLPGPLFREAHDVVAYTLDRLADDARMEEEYVRRADKFVDHRDTGACDRIFDVVASATPTPRHIEIPHEYVQSGSNVLRRQSFYFPAVRRTFRYLRALPLDENIMVFESGVGRQMNDSPLAIYDELVRRGDTRTKVWVYNKNITVPDEHTILVKRNSPQYFWYLARAKYWINDQNFAFYVQTRGKGTYLQTWHGTPLKRMLNDLDEFVGRDSGYHGRVTQAIAQWTDLLSPSPYATEKFASAFRHDARVHEIGLPRNDSLHADGADEARRRVRESLKIPADNTAVLYAPTFRDDVAKPGGKFGYTAPFSLVDLLESLPDQVVLLVRFHVVVTDRPKVPAEYRDRIVDVSGYSELNDLFLASDMLITDYSSLYFDYAGLRKPMIFFAYDLDNYRDNLRGFYLDYESSVPGPVVEELADLQVAVHKAHQFVQSPAMDEFLDRYAPHDDGYAANRAVDILLK